MPLIIGRMTTRAYVNEGINSIRDLAITYKKYGVAPRLIAALEEISQQRKNGNDQETAKSVKDAIKQINDAKA